MKKSVSIVVTFNRLELLKENIKALKSQNCDNHDILIVNNASTDGTEEFVLKLNDSKIKYFNTGKNLGGAGGFAFGLKKAIEMNYDYAWLMDDDSIPQKNSLNNLIDTALKLKDKFSFLASRVYWTDNKIFPMNLPRFTYSDSLYNNLQLLFDSKIIEIETCSFVGCFVNLKIAKNVALPITDFFIYGDDIEYTTRLRKKEKAYFDIDSLIIHKAPSNKGSDIVSTDFERISRFYYQSRNGVYYARKNHCLFKRFCVISKRILKIIVSSNDHKFIRIWTLIKGSAAGFFFNPKLEYVCNGDNNEE